MKYNDGNAKKYGTRNPLKRLMINNFQNKLMDVIKQYSSKNITLLDAGCGEGFISNLIYDKIDGCKICGVDYFAEAIEQAKAENLREIDFQIGDITDLSFKNKAFDLVLATEVLEHLTYPECALEELLRVADKAVILSVPNEPFFCLGNLFSGKNISRLGNPLDHINHFSFWGFKSFLQKQLNDQYAIKLYWGWVWTIAVIERKDV